MFLCKGKTNFSALRIIKCNNTNFAKSNPLQFVSTFKSLSQTPFLFKNYESNLKLNNNNNINKTNFFYNNNLNTTFNFAKHFCTSNEDTILFSDIKNLSPERLAVLHEKGFKEAFPIQHKTFDLLFEGRDVLGRARTGTGKTIAFCLPLIERHFPIHGRLPSHCTVLILEPTRELALQTQREFAALDRSIKTLCCYGGTSVGGNGFFFFF